MREFSSWTEIQLGEVKVEAIKEAGKSSGDKFQKVPPYMTWPEGEG